MSASAGPAGRPNVAPVPPGGARDAAVHEDGPHGGQRTAGARLGPGPARRPEFRRRDHRRCVACRVRDAGEGVCVALQNLPSARRDASRPPAPGRSTARWGHGSGYAGRRPLPPLRVHSPACSGLGSAGLAGPPGRGRDGRPGGAGPRAANADGKGPRAGGRAGAAAVVRAEAVARPGHGAPGDAPPAPRPHRLPRVLHVHVLRCRRRPDPVDRRLRPAAALPAGAVARRSERITALEAMHLESCCVAPATECALVLDGDRPVRVALRSGEAAPVFQAPDGRRIGIPSVDAAGGRAACALSERTPGFTPLHDGGELLSPPASAGVLPGHAERRRVRGRGRGRVDLARPRAPAAPGHDRVLP